jgi:hypothetical protein
MNVVEKPEHRLGPNLRSLSIGFSIGVMALVALGALVFLQARQGVGATSGASITPPPTVLTEGVVVGRDDAIAAAREHVPPDRTVVRATLGPYSAAPLPSRADRPGAAADQMVWVVEFEGSFEICNPLGACLSPRPGSSYVVVDAVTGSWITTYSFSAP